MVAKRREVKDSFRWAASGDKFKTIYTRAKIRRSERGLASQGAEFHAPKSSNSRLASFAAEM